MPKPQRLPRGVDRLPGGGWRLSIELEKLDSAPAGPAQSANAPPPGTQAPSHSASSGSSETPPAMGQRQPLDPVPQAAQPATTMTAVQPHPGGGASAMRLVAENPEPAPAPEPPMAASISERASPLYCSALKMLPRE